MFIGRKEELDFLEEKYKSNKTEFIVLYGRRRIGKTFLIQEFIKNKPHVFYSAVEVTDSVQLTKMSTIVQQYFKKDIYSDRFSDWEALFKFIIDNVNENKEKIIIALDEFPYMVQGNKSIPSIIQKLWDHYFSKLNIMLIICGSSMSFMEKKVLSEKNPLYGRTTGVLKIQEMDFESSRGFMGKGSLEDHINYYSVFSGVPYYLSMISPEDSFENNLKKNILSNNSVLFNEAEFLLKQELREVSQYNAIIESIALGNTKINDIYQKTGIEKTKIPFYIGSLIELGIVRKEYPSTIKTKEQIKSRMGIYKIDNSYFRFYYAFVYPYISELLEGGADIIYEEVILKRLSMFVSWEFENIAISKLRELGKNNLLPIRPIKIGRWWHKDNEIDIVACDIKNNFIFGECKWKREKVSSRTLEQLKIKSSNIGEKVKRSSYVLFSKSGFTDEILRYAYKNKEVTLVDYSGIEPRII
ncbi:ATP-binding protein [Herbivorax sp. ANBcel31]|uniref:ATP-binding protein n=1 Tax=Herbivorax sp. ANBcel31 TaxID=3069754 RepID=UPI0027B60D77|nr:ATP-binding protein [Herbivorax sp. ANBcel31]MDQ2087074.1 ATP-binding protein [Herbivorax sp. ANBcel31]